MKAAAAIAKVQYRAIHSTCSSHNLTAAINVVPIIIQIKVDWTICKIVCRQLRNFAVQPKPQSPHLHTLSIIHAYGRWIFLLAIMGIWKFPTTHCVVSIDWHAIFWNLCYRRFASYTQKSSSHESVPLLGAVAPSNPKLGLTAKVAPIKPKSIPNISVSPTIKTDAIPSTSRSAYYLSSSANEGSNRTDEKADNRKNENSEKRKKEDKLKLKAEKEARKVWVRLEWVNALIKSMPTYNFNFYRRKSV